MDFGLCPTDPIICWVRHGCLAHAHRDISQPPVLKSCSFSSNRLFWMQLYLQLCAVLTLYLVIFPDNPSISLEDLLKCANITVVLDTCQYCRKMEASFNYCESSKAT